METMYPGYCLGSGVELDRAMDIGLELAVDVSHIYMQLNQQVLGSATWDRLQVYDNVSEIHLSSNDGSRDQHRVVDAGTFGFDWATARAADGTPLILESYMHRRPRADRQLEIKTILTAIEVQK